MSDEQEYTIGELAAAAEVTTRTIRYYTAEGLLAPPATHGKYARYNTDHLVRLQLIARLKESFLPLGEIRRQLDALSTAEIQALLDIEPEPEATSSAAAYLTQILDARTPTNRVAEPAGRYRAAAAESQQDALGFQPPAARAALPAAPPPAAPAAKSTGWIGRLLGGNKSESTATPSVSKEHWQRITLAHGVELHVREPQAPEVAPRIAQLIAHAQALFHHREEDTP